MSAIGPLNAGLAGLHANIERLERGAEHVARAGVSDALPDHLVDMLTSQRGVEASARVVKTADEMIGTLLDVLA